MTEATLLRSQRLGLGRGGSIKAYPGTLLACLACFAFFQRFCEVGVRVNTVGLGWSRLLGGSLRYMSRCPQARGSPTVWKSLECLYDYWAQKDVSSIGRIGFNLCAPL